jgi:outer membrane immunogenic protein
MKKLLLGSVALIALAGSAVAADLPQRPVAPVMAPMPIYNWTGFYVGGNLGGAWGTLNVTDVNTGVTASPNNGGFAGGVQFGYDYQIGPWVIGIRNMFDGTSISNGATISDGVFSGTVNSHLHWFDTLTARGGYLVQPNLLLYAQGGAAWTSWDITANNAAGVQIGEISGGNRTGWTVGGGVEWMFLPHWSVFAEYNFMGFGTRSSASTVCAGAVCTTDTFSAKADLQNALIGVNYKF